MSVLTGLDTSVIIAALVSWHEAHARALEGLKDAAARGRWLIPLPALVEAYAVLTRLPSPHRLSPHDAQALLAGTFEGRAVVVNLGTGVAWRWLDVTAKEGVAGGMTYDALLLACAKLGKASRFLTLDANDFLRLDAQGIEIVVP